MLDLIYMHIHHIQLYVHTMRISTYMYIYIIYHIYHYII